MDLFVDRSEKSLNKYFGDRKLELWTVGNSEYEKEYAKSLNQEENVFLRFPVKTKGDGNIQLPFSIEVLLDFNQGLWEIHAWVKAWGYTEEIYPTSQNAQSICKTMLLRMKDAHLSKLDARHSGYSRASYLGKGVGEKIDENTIHSAAISFSHIGHINRVVECHRKKGDPLKKATIKLEGDWK